MTKIYVVYETNWDGVILLKGFIREDMAELYADKNNNDDNVEYWNDIAEIELVN